MTFGSTFACLAQIMPKGLKKMDVRGAEQHWFECGCGYRWEGASQSAKNLAHRLHKKNCNTGELTNKVTGHRDFSQSKAERIDKDVAKMKVSHEAMRGGE